jgi:Fe2+ or Zn2+ uptake regulation protein
MFASEVISMWERLTETGYKLTSPRRRVLEALRAAPEPLAAQDIAARAGTSVASTYRSLALLAELGVVSEVAEPATGDLPGAAGARVEGGVRRYALCTLHGHHHHFVCRGCHVTFDIESAALEQALAELEQLSGMRIERHEVRLSGQCARCRTHAAEGAGA